MPAVARILARFDREQVEGFIAVALDLLDPIDGPADPDAPDFTPRTDGLPGDPADPESAGDDDDAAWIEWHAMRGSQKRGPNIAGHEDAEDDDPAGQYNEEYHTGPLPRGYGPECPISDPDTWMEDERERPDEGY